MKPDNFPTAPAHLWKIFYDFTQTPRPSKQESKIVQYLIDLASEAKLKYIKDRASNIIIYVPASKGREDDDPVIIQNHIDMVTDALPSVQIDFSQDPIQTYIDGDWLGAVGTTLGADNGIGCAAALALIFEPDISHPALELLFTTDEETGLNGALNLEEKYLSGKKMLNLDTEEWGSVYIGCAGGIDYELTKELLTQVAVEDKICLKIEVEGFVGGHSGIDIHEQRGNAIKFLGELLSGISSNLSQSLQIAEIRGGKAHNIIPRDAFAVIYINKNDKGQIEQVISTLVKSWQSYLPVNDKEFSVNVQDVPRELFSEVLNFENTKEILNYITLFPHGAHTYDLSDRSLVSSSNNFAKFLLIKGNIYTQSSLRFFDREEIKPIELQIYSLGDLLSMKVEKHSEYPSWKPVRKNPLLDLVLETYEEIFDKKPVVTAIHAGLECGILKDKIGEIDVVSFGPTITGAHSPDERVHIPSVEAFWQLFKEVLSKI